MKQCHFCKSKFEPKYKHNPNKFCSQACYHAYARGENSGRYRGHCYISAGRRFIFMPGHHLANAKGYVPEHRLIAEQKIGKRLIPGEVVHHLNDDKLDNRPENLEVISSQIKHASIHSCRQQKLLASKTCPRCGEIFSGRPSAIKLRKYCSSACHYEVMRERNAFRLIRQGIKVPSSA